MDITVTEFADRWGVSPQYIRQLIKAGDIRPRGTMGKTYVITEAEYRRASKSAGRL
ncbi:MAG: helix-turn-helix domain-containing protein [Planctomycetota bacterium]|nr:helix-turn-helix domain-containing protein [Planctomycetota bacterium]